MKIEDIIQPVSLRSELKSCRILMDEQSYLLRMLFLTDIPIQHRGGNLQFR